MILNGSSSSDLPAQNNGRTHRVFLIDSHTILRDAVRLMIEADDAFDVVGEAGTVAGALPLIDVLEPDVVVTDIPMPHVLGIQLISALRACRPQLAILVLTTIRTPDRVAAALNAGAQGYILKECRRAELLVALSEVAAGRRYMSKGACTPNRDSTACESSPSGSTTPANLTPRQREVLRSVALGYGNKEIAHMLGVTAKAVQKHRDRLRSVLNVQSTAGLTMYAVREGLVSGLRTIDAPPTPSVIPVSRARLRPDRNSA
ncbi:MAG: LuxR family transcriptional regulator [Gammaproteobacteria bacterium]|nr:LuxR family transcriptional regulator [Gammaproteobacteria bacterium]